MHLTVAQSSHSALSICLGYIEGAPDREQHFPLKWANRHMVLTGLTGTGKTETLKTIVTGFSHAGVPCFLPDVKGDLDVLSRVAPTRFWDLEGDLIETIQVSVRDMGSMVFSRMLGLSDAQRRVTTIIFAVARRHGMPLETFDDVRTVLDYIEDEVNKKEIARLGHVSTATVGIIRSTLLELEEQNADQFFGPTSFALEDLMDTHEGQGIVSILNAKNLMRSPAAYSCFLMWLLCELSDKLPEIGDTDKPRLAFFFDEAHLLFKGASDAFVETMENTVRLIRSKGVSVNLISQTISDIPEPILAQLTTIIQHRFTARTTKERSALRAAADAFKPNAALDPLTDVIENLAVGWAVVQVLDQKGSRMEAQRVHIRRCDIPASNPVIEVPARVMPVLVVDNTPKALPEPVEPVLTPEALWAALGEFQDVSAEKMARVRAYLHEVMATTDGGTYGTQRQGDAQPGITLETADGVGRIRLATAGRAEEYLIPVA